MKREGCVSFQGPLKNLASCIKLHIGNRESMQPVRMGKRTRHVGNHGIDKPACSDDSDQSQEHHFPVQEIADLLSCQHIRLQIEMFRRKQTTTPRNVIGAWWLHLPRVHGRLMRA